MTALTWADAVKARCAAVTSNPSVVKAILYWDASTNPKTAETPTVTTTGQALIKATRVEEDPRGKGQSYALTAIVQNSETLGIEEPEYHGTLEVEGRKYTIDSPPVEIGGAWRIQGSAFVRDESSSSSARLKSGKKG